MPRLAQDARRAAGLDVSDRINVVLEVPQDCKEWAERHRELIAGEVLATSFSVGEAGDDAVDLGEGIRAAITKV